jgi:hypothetical protein
MIPHISHDPFSKAGPAAAREWFAGAQHNSRSIRKPQGRSTGIVRDKSGSLPQCG